MKKWLKGGNLILTKWEAIMTEPNIQQQILICYDDIDRGIDFLLRMLKE